MPYRDALSAEPAFADINEELRWACRAVADKINHEPMAVNLSSSDDFAAVKVICPGLNNSTRHVIPWPDYRRPA
ncbi:hypothetical protein ACIPJS_37515 [Streptomyces sp. NPDC086783]|uniref:hypothetical protein n=1 Tax=Streptomyces sp. NPDC086783 TaxID=3365758 RepID=UPI0037F5BBC1